MSDCPLKKLIREQLYIYLLEAKTKGCIEKFGQYLFGSSATNWYGKNVEEDTSPFSDIT